MNDLRSRARAARSEGRIEEAIALERRAAAEYLAQGDSGSHFHALRHVADLLSESGDPAAAAALYAEVLAFHRGDGSLDAANATRAAAVNAERLGDTGEARRLWRAARELYEGLDASLAERTGGNPGVEEADRRLTALAG